MRAQRYIWWKKSVETWSKEHPFPIDIDYMISDTLELLRPKMRISGSLEDAAKQVADLEREVLVKLGTSRRAAQHGAAPCWPGVCVCVGVQSEGVLAGRSGRAAFLGESALVSV